MSGIQFRVTADPYGFKEYYEVRCLWNVPHGMTEPFCGVQAQGKGYLCNVDARSTQDYGEVIPPFMKLTREQAQQFMDAMYEAGVRPSNGEGSTGQLAAVKEHLAHITRYSDSMLEMLLKTEIKTP